MGTYFSLNSINAIIHLFSDENLTKGIRGLLDEFRDDEMVESSSSDGETSQSRPTTKNGSKKDSNEMVTSLNRMTIPSHKNEEVDNESRPHKRKVCIQSNGHPFFLVTSILRRPLLYLLWQLPRLDKALLLWVCCIS